MLIDYQAFGAQLQSIRVQRDLTQEQLAEDSKLSAHYIGNLEQGVRKPSINSLIQLCNALGTTPDRLFKDSISLEMQNGVPVPVSDEDLLRSFLDALPYPLSDSLPYDKDEEFTLFGIPIHQIRQAAEPPAEETLTDLLRFSNPDSIPNDP